MSTRPGAGSRCRWNGVSKTRANSPAVTTDSDTPTTTVTQNAGVLTVRGVRPLPDELQNARIIRMEIPHGNFERRIELPAVPFEILGRHLSNGCLMLRLQKGVR
jgi:hypothetical protein